MSIDKNAACDEAWQEYIKRWDMDHSHETTARRAWDAAWERAIRHADDWSCLRTDPDQYPLQQAHAVPTIHDAIRDIAILTEHMARGR